MPRRPRRSQASTSRQASRCVVPTDSGASTTSDSESSLGASPSHGFGPDDEPTREDLRSICVQVSHQIAEDHNDDVEDKKTSKKLEKTSQENSNIMFMYETVI